jgi:hypothetical protein
MTTYRARLPYVVKGHAVGHFWDGGTWTRPVLGGIHTLCGRQIVIYEEETIERGEPSCKACRRHRVWREIEQDHAAALRKEAER